MCKTFFVFGFWFCWFARENEPTFSRRPFSLLPRLWYSLIVANDNIQIAVPPVACTTNPVPSVCVRVPHSPSLDGGGGCNDDDDSPITNENNTINNSLLTIVIPKTKLNNHHSSNNKLDSSPSDFATLTVRECAKNNKFPPQPSSEQPSLLLHRLQVSLFPTNSFVHAIIFFWLNDERFFNL